MMRQEGVDHDLFRFRAAGRGFKTRSMTWFIESRCAVQLPAGDARDPTFTKGATRGGNDRIVQRLAPHAIAQISDAVSKNLFQVSSTISGEYFHLNLMHALILIMDTLTACMREVVAESLGEGAADGASTGAEFRNEGL